MWFIKVIWGENKKIIECDAKLPGKRLILKMFKDLDIYMCTQINEKIITFLKFQKSFD